MTPPRLCELQQRLLDWKLDDLLHPQAPPGKRGRYDRIFTPLITLWYLIYQRLSPDQSLALVVLDALQGGADALATNPCPPSQALRATNTGSYSDARKRLPEAVLREVYEHSTRKLASGQAVGSLARVQLIDGTLLATLATPKLSLEYPPARNQHGTSDWCQMRSVVAFDWHNGAAQAASQAPTSTSEQALVWEIFRQSAPGTLSVGDRNFGVFSVLQAARHHRQEVLVRLTALRAKSLGGAHWHSGQEQLVRWTPTGHDQLHAQAEATPVTGRLIFLRVERPGFKTVELWLFTTLLEGGEFTPQVLLELYGIRWRAETNFNYLKTQLNLRELSGRTPEMVRKEFYAALIAYNLIREAMQSCAHILQVSVQRVSFQAVRRAVGHGLARLMAEDGGKLRRLRGLLLPTRTKVRPNEPREVRKRNQTYPPLRGPRADARIRAANLLAETCQPDNSTCSSPNPSLASKS